MLARRSLLGRMGRTFSGSFPHSIRSGRGPGRSSGVGPADSVSALSSRDSKWTTSSTSAPSTKTASPSSSPSSPRGSFQGLLLAAQIVLAQPESVLLLEEPESNLHPAYEKELAALLGDGVQLGHQLIVTTHSEILVAAVANLVRKQVLRPEQVAILELTRDAQGVSAKDLGVTASGLTEWVKSFTKVEASLSQEWADGIPEER